jgi:transposase
MEGYNGHARPLDRHVQEHGYRLLNVNNLKLARFKEIFPGPAKSDAIDTHRILELLRLQTHVPLAKPVVHEVREIPAVNAKLQRLTRRRRQLISEKVRILNRMQSELQAVCPGLVAITRSVASRWFLELLSCRSHLEQIAKLRLATLRKLNRVGVKHAAMIRQWQPSANFTDDVEWVGPMIIADAKRAMALLDEIKGLRKQIEASAKQSTLYQRMTTVPGFGWVSSAELAGEIGDHRRFASEASLALYTGATNLDNNSGTQRGSKPTQQVNRRAKSALMNAVDHHRRHVTASRVYYEKKCAQGKNHNQSIRALARHMIRVLWSMFVHDRDYELRTESSLAA